MPSYFAANQKLNGFKTWSKDRIDMVPNHLKAREETNQKKQEKSERYLQVSLMV